MFRSCSSIAVVALSSLLAAPAFAQPIPQDGVSATEIHSWLQGQGLDARINTEASTPQVLSGANGISWDVTGFDCQADRCRSWQFSAGFRMESAPDGSVARWNQERRYLKAYETERDGARAAIVQYDVLLTVGSTWEGLTEQMHLFAGTAPLFAVAIGAATID